MEPGQVTIVVLNWNQRDETIACLESLAKADLGGASVLAVDNGSRDGSVQAMRTRFPEQRILALPQNEGFAGGNNAGIRKALDDGAEGVLLLNNDTRVAPDFLLPLLWTLRDNPRAAAVCSAILRVDRPEMLDVAYAEVHFDERDAVRILGVNALPGLGFDKRREVEVAIGCSLLLKAEALRTVGLFDEAYFAYHEEVDWCLRARKVGYQIFFEPYSRVFHHGSMSTKDLRERPPLDPLAPDDPDLPNAEPMPWNPVSAYMGARNLVRLLRAHATRRQQWGFVRSCLYELPLEFFAVVLDREGWMRLGRWDYRELLRFFFVKRHPILRSKSMDLPSRLMKALAVLILAPIDLFWSLPRTIWRVHRLGRTTQYLEYIHGLWDGLLNRPLPLERLGLREPKVGDTSHAA